MNDITHTELIEGLLKLEGIRSERIVDLKIVMKFTGGKVNPSSNPILIRPNGYDELLFTIYDAVDFLKKYGLMRC